MTDSMSGGFPRHIENALDSYKVPALSEGFADRVVSAATAQDNSAPKTATFVPSQRDRDIGKNGPWKRSRFFVSSVAGMAMLSTAAAAALSLAEIPVRIPIVSDLVERVLPRAAAPIAAAKAVSPVSPSISKPDADAQPSADNAIMAETDEPKRWRDLDRPEKIERVKQRVQENEKRIQARRAANGLPPLTKVQLQRRRIAKRRAIRNGSIRRSAARKALRRAAIRKRAENRGVIPPRRNIIKSDSSPEKRTSTAKTVGSRNIAPAPPANNPPETAVNPQQQPPVALTPSNSDSQSQVPVTTTVPDTAIRTRLQEKLPDRLKTKWRNASPRERRRILREARSKRQNSKTMRDARKRLRDVRRKTK